MCCYFENGVCVLCCRCCERNGTRLRWFSTQTDQLRATKAISVKTIFTSRQSPYIEAIFRESIVVKSNLNRRFIEQDIDTYVGHVLPNLNQVSVTVEDRHLIKTIIHAKATGIFLYANLMTREIIHNLDRCSLEELLSSLPVGISGITSDRTLKSGSSNQIEVNF